MTDLAMMRIEQVSALVESGAVSPVELTEACLTRIEKLGPRLNAYVYLDAGAAREAARQAEAEIAAGRYRGRLHGIPIALKDLYYTEGIPTTAGSRVLRDFVPAFNGTVVRRLLDAGAVLLGKTNTHEFAFGPTTEESCFGPTRNPWDPRRISGGSSGGSAAAAAAGMAYLAMGTDTGGSVRIPAAMCGVVGFKPSIGLASLHGIVPLSFSLDHPGPLCRSVADAAITMDAITGADANDPCPYAAQSGATRFYEAIANVEDLRGKVLGIPANFFFDKTDYGVERVFFEAVERLKALGAEIRAVEIPGLELVTEASTCLMFSEAAWLHRAWYPRRKDLYQPGVARRLEQGGAYPATAYIQAIKDREKLMAAWERTMADLDAILSPTCPITAFAIGLGEPWYVETRGRREPGKTMATYHTRLANMTGGPALSVPAGLTEDGLPAGLMIMGRRNDDRGVLAIGMAYERSWTYPVPPL